MAQRVAGRVRQTSTAADPGTIPALSKEDAEQRDHDQRAQKAVQNVRERQLEDVPRYEVIEFERPEVAEIIFGLVKETQNLWNRKRERDLDKHHYRRAGDLVPVVPAYAYDVYSTGYNRKGVNQAVQRPFAAEADCVSAASKQLGVIKDEIETNYYGSQQPGGDSAMREVMS